MQLSNEAIQDFKRIYKKEYGKDISDEEANELGLNFLNFFKIILKKPPEKLNNNQNHGGNKEEPQLHNLRP